MKQENLVLENAQGQTLRYISWTGDKALVYKNLQTGRIELVEEARLLDEQEISYEPIQEIERRDLENQGVDLNRVRLRLVKSVGEIVPNVSLPDEDDEEFKKITKWTTFSHIGLFIILLIGGTILSWSKKEESLTVVTIMQTPKEVVETRRTVAPTKRTVKPITKTKVSNRTKKVAQTRRQATKKVGRSAPSPVPVEQMGALGALGGMKTGKKGSSGFQINAKNSSLGSDLKRIGSGGRGGFDKAVYGKGVISGPIGTGGVRGSGGYSTRGQGGGRPGYGAMKISGGSAGGYSLPLEEEALVEGGLSKDQIAAVIQRNIGQIIYCYEKGLQVEPDLNGRVAVNFIIGGRGSVSSARINHTSLNDRPVEGCILNKLRAWKFPKPSGNVNVKVTYPFLLKRAG